MHGENRNFTQAPRRGFTLLELLIVVGVLGILATVVVLVLNPTEYLKRSRDSNRIQDMQSLRKALDIAELENKNLGLANTVSVSIPDTSATCVNLGLPALPAGWDYRCVLSDNLSRVDGTGWVPVNLTSISTNSPLAKLPVDPVNTTSSGLYYTYTPGGSFEINAQMESEKNRISGEAELVAKDGGDSYGLYEVGSDLKLSPISDSGLVGYWKLDGNSNDSSESNNNGTENGGMGYVSGKVGQAGNFDGVNDYITTATQAVDVGNMTFMAWARPTVTGGNHMLLSGNNHKLSWGYLGGNGNDIGWNISGSLANTNMRYQQPNTWYFMAGVRQGTTANLYVDGALSDTKTNNGGGGFGANTQAYYAIGILFSGVTPVYFWNGIIDEVRVYNRALSEAEIRSIYNATR